MLSDFLDTLRHLLTSPWSLILKVGLPIFLLYSFSELYKYRGIKNTIQNKYSDERDIILRKKFPNIPPNQDSIDWFKSKKIKIESRHKKTLIFTILYFISVLFAGISFLISPSPYLTIHGSNTIGSRLVPELAKAFLERKLQADQIEIRENKNEPVEKLVTGRGQFVRLAIETHGKGSGTGFKCIIENQCDIGMSSREIKTDEKTKILSKFNAQNFSNDFETTIAIDGVAVIVQKGNPIEELSLKQLADIFSGRITNWEQITNQKNGKINLYVRDENSGTREVFVKKALNGKKISSDAENFEDSTKLSNRVANDRQGIGFISQNYIRNAKAIKIFDNGTKPLLPDKCFMVTEEYLLSRRLYLYLPEWWRKGEKERYIKSRDFVNFSLSPEGQKIVENEDFIPVANLEQDINNCSISDGGSTITRIPVTLFFKVNSNQLDSKGIQDIDRIVELLQKPDFQDKDVIVRGFADNRGNPEVNLKISQQRAEYVADLLRQKGVTPKIVRGFGEENPIASNDSEEGRQKNRRVEIWLQ